MQAVVKDALTQTTLDTVNLADNGGQNFSKSYIAPHDISQTGTGRWIIVIYTCYTDSGYTTKNPRYGTLTEKYLVKTLVDPLMMGGGGGTVDAVMLKKIMNEIMDERKPEDPLPMFGAEKPQMDYAPMISELKNAIQSVSEKVDNIKFPDIPKMEIPRTDLAPLGSAFQTGIEKILRKIHLLPVGPNYDEAVSQLTALTDIQTTLRDEFQKEADTGKTVLEQYKTMLSVLDEKTVALLSVLEYLKNMSADKSEETNSIADAIKMMQTVKKARIPYRA